MLLFGLLWAALVRLPFANRATIDGDAAMFWIIGHGWLQDQIPYQAYWDVKPPGVFLIFGAAAALFRADPLGGKLFIAIAVGVASAGLYRVGECLLRNAKAGLAAALLFPPYTLLLDGLGCKPELLAAPFVIWGIALALDARARPSALLAAGTLIGFAGTIKQTVAFEAAFVLILLAIDQRRSVRLPAFLAGLAVAPFAFCIYFAAHGLLGALVDACVLGALARLHGDGGTFADAPVRLLVALKPALFLLAGAGLCWAERRRIDWTPGSRPLVWGWLAATALGALAMRVAYPPYVLPLLAPLSLATGSVLARLWQVRPLLRGLAGFLLLLGLAAPLMALRLLPADGAEDPTPAVIAATINRIMPGKPIYVVDYEPLVYQLSHAPVPTRYPLPQHLVCDFPALPVRPEDEMRRIVASHPVAIVVSASHHRMACEKSQRVDAVMHLAAASGYRLRQVFPTPYGPVELWVG